MLTSAVTAWTPQAPAAPPSADPGEDVDGALVRAAGRGDATAFEAIYRRHNARVHGVILRLVGGHAGRAEDLTQEAFVRCLAGAAGVPVRERVHDVAASPGREHRPDGIARAPQPAAGQRRRRRASTISARPIRPATAPR